MPHEFSVDQAARLLRVRYSGEVGVSERREVIGRLMAESATTGFHRMLIDFRSAHSKPADPREVMRLVDSYAPQLPPDTRLAYLLRYDHQLDTTFEVFARERGVQVERFMDLDAAMAWLQAAGSAPPPAEASVARALRLAAEAIGDDNDLRPDQVAAISELVHALLVAGADESAIRPLAGRIAAAMAPRQN